MFNSVSLTELNLLNGQDVTIKHGFVNCEPYVKNTQIEWCHDLIIFKIIPSFFILIYRLALAER